MKKIRKQSGFVFLELAIGLPLIIMLVWTLSGLFVGTWKNCRDMIADFTLQMEVNDAMIRIVDDMRTASRIDKPRADQIVIHSNVFETSSGKIQETDTVKNTINEDAADPDDTTFLSARRPIVYWCVARASDSTKRYIYRQRRTGAKSNPITGGDILSDVHITKFDVVEEEENLWSITIEGISNVSGHSYELKTKVFLEGASN